MDSADNSAPKRIKFLRIDDLKKVLEITDANGDTDVRKATKGLVQMLRNDKQIRELLNQIPKSDQQKSFIEVIDAVAVEIEKMLNGEKYDPRKHIFCRAYGKLRYTLKQHPNKNIAILLKKLREEVKKIAVPMIEEYL